MPEWKTEFEAIGIGKGRIIKEGEDVALLTIGHIGNYAVEATESLTKEGINIGHFDMRFVKPIDEELLHHICENYEKIVTVEDGCLPGGFGTSVLEFIADNNYRCNVKRLGIPDRIVEHGSQLELHKECGFDPEGIKKAVLEVIALVIAK
jgi:1-deoxy-D-xylulose-5-phosphate synthase